ncbi:MAG: molybdate ABC transporter substrate-binding protein, partial [Chloroflexi bacterium]|nr:molybdate ABC transporter substrate-binding protein [Chloroflexota bacterium]
MTGQHHTPGAIYRFSLAVLLTLVALAFSTGCQGKTNDEPLFFAAASLADVLTEAAQAYEQQTGNDVLFSFGGSNTLANQVVSLNAPADAVIMAGQSPMQRLVDAGKIDAPDISIVALNTLVVISTDTSGMSDITDITSTTGRIAIADPDLAPAGQYARDALQAAGVWDSLQDRIVPTLDVRAAIAAVSSGSARYAIVYATDAITEPQLEVALEIDQQLYSRVEYPAAVISGSRQSEKAASFITFLQTPGAAEIFRRYGFT